MRHSSVRLDSGDSLARARTKSASVSAHAHRTPCRIPGVPLNAPPRLSPRSLWFVALTRSACQRHMVTQREGRNGRDAILCVRNRSQIGRNEMRPSRCQMCALLMGWQRGRETYRGRLGGTPRPTVCQVCALLMGWRKRERETYRGRLGGTPRPTVGQVCALLVCGSSVGASGNACAVSIERVPTAGKGRGGADANGSARGRLDAQDAAETAGAGAGRYSDQARHPVAADGLRRPGRTSRAGRERSAAENRRTQTCQPWRITRPPSRAALMQRRGSLSDRSRRQSCDCRGGGRNARRAYAQGLARLARYPPHDDRQHTHGKAPHTPHSKAARRDASPHHAEG